MCFFFLFVYLAYNFYINNNMRYFPISKFLGKYRVSQPMMLSIRL